jgi:hypothetical protein
MRTSRWARIPSWAQALGWMLLGFLGSGTVVFLVGEILGYGG